MVKDRMIRIIRYLNKERTGTYREIADSLGIKERMVRYDVDGINDELSLRRLPSIEKLPQGVLAVPEGVDLECLLREDTNFVFTQEERIAILRMDVLMDTEQVKIQKLADMLQVSRRSVKYDLEQVEQEIGAHGLSLHYEKKFYLTGESQKSYDLRSREFKSYVRLLYRGQPGSACEQYMYERIFALFAPVPLQEILQWIDRIMEAMNWVLSDDSYQWYVANVLTFTWYLIKEIPLPQTEWCGEGQIDQSVREYETYVGRSLTEKERGILSGFAKYTNRYVSLDVSSKLVLAEEITLDLIHKMEKEFCIDFSGDGILMKGLLNHMVPMLERVDGQVQIYEEAESLISEEYRYVYEALKQIVKKSDLACLPLLTDSEIIYLAVHFMGSIRRMQQDSYQRVLLICGFGYGATALVKDALLNEFQVQVKACIPAYKVQEKRNWEEIDVVISTVKVDLPVEKTMAQVHVIFDKEDYSKLSLLGLRRKHVLTHFFAMKKRLDFLQPVEREQVMDIVKEELGYQEVRMPAKYYGMMDLLSEDTIVCVDRIEGWRSAVRLCTQMLEKKECITEAYYDNIIRGMEIQGFYSVTDQKFALLNGSETAGVETGGMSLLLTKEPVFFGDKSVRVIFCLASRDKKEHTPAVIQLVKMAGMKGFVEELEECLNAEEAMQTIRKWTKKA